MKQLYYSDPSLADLDGILDYIAIDNRKAAVKLGNGILETCELLAQNPKLGVLRDDISDGIRLFVYRGYGIYYRYVRNQVLIERILHAALDVKQQSFES